MKTYFGKKGYTVFIKDLSDEKISKIKEDLTFTPYKPQGYGPDSKPFSIFKYSKDKLFLPKFYGISLFGNPDENKLDDPEKINIEFNGKLRDNQLKPIETCLQASEEIGGGILCAGCGSGKTTMSCYIISKKGVKALIVVNKEFLMDQWKERIQQFLPDARIGIIRQKKIDIDNKDIVIAMLQSISMCDYDISIFSSFGIVFYDEVHCVPSKIFSKALQKINTKYHFGLSATPNRSDGMTKVTKLYIGPVVYKTQTDTTIKNPKNVHVFSIHIEKLNNHYYKNLFNYMGKPDIVKMISNIIKCQDRLFIICKLLEFFIVKDKRHILVLSERIQYLKDIEKVLQKSTFKIGYYIGGMKNKERKESEKADLILASYSMAKEAMDIPILDTLCMVTSKSNIEQSVGRILRQTVYPKERPPLILDINDSMICFQNQYQKRVDFYSKNAYPIIDFCFENKETVIDTLESKMESFLESKNIMEEYKEYM